MKLAISNLAWSSLDDEVIARLLQSMGITGVELAPTKIWEDPLAVSDAEVDDYRELWKSYGIEVVAIQSLLFGRPDLQLFGSVNARADTLEYLVQMTRLAGRLGTTAMVFGSPKNRLRGELTELAAARIATPFFRTLAETAAENGVAFCLEPNPARYGADWIITTADALTLADAVDHEGFGINADTGGMTLSGEDPATAIEACAAAVRHFHISEPDLAPIGASGVNHSLFAAALARVNYSGWRSIEMREPLPGSGGSLSTAIAAACQNYGGD